MHPGKCLIETAGDVPDKLAVLADDRPVTNKELPDRVP